jgi:hypothetical protein
MPETLSDGGLYIGTIRVRLNGHAYVFTQAKYDKPVTSAYERDSGEEHADGAPRLIAGHHQKDPEKISGEVKAYRGTPEPPQLVPFAYRHRDGKTRYWAFGPLSLNYSNAQVTSYTCELVPIFNQPAAGN